MNLFHFRILVVSLCLLALAFGFVAGFLCGVRFSTVQRDVSADLVSKLYPEQPEEL